MAGNKLKEVPQKASSFAAPLPGRFDILKPFGLILLIILTGTLGYSFLEGWSIFDALYMTVITITTIGYREVHVLSPVGQGFTMLLILFSVGAVLYSLNSAARIIIEGELKDIFGRRKLLNAIEKLRGHYIVCGYGRMGRIIGKELAAKGAGFVVVERHKPEGAGLGPSGKTLIVYGDATRDDVLLQAGIKEARGLISVLPTDAENLYVVLSARGLNPTLNIVARAVDEGTEQKLLRAGADRVVSPYHIGGLRIAHTILKPAVVDFIEFTTQSGNIDLEMEEVAVGAGAELAGKTLAESGIGRTLGIVVVAIKLASGKLRINPTHDTVIMQGDTLIVIGEEEKLKVLEEMARGTGGGGRGAAG